MKFPARVSVCFLLSLSTTIMARVPKTPPGEAARVCIHVHVAPGIWPPGMTPNADKDLSSFLSGLLSGLLQEDKGDPYTWDGESKIVRRDDYLECMNPNKVKIELSYLYLPNGKPFLLIYRYSINGNVTEKSFNHDISNEIFSSISNRNQLYISNDIRSRAREIYPLIKPYL